MVGPEGYRLAAQDLTIDLKERRATGSGGVSGEMKLGRFEAGRLRGNIEFNAKQSGAKRLARKRTANLVLSKRITRRFLPGTGA